MLILSLMGCQGHPADALPRCSACVIVIGVRSTGPAITDAEGRWFEPIAPDRLEPQDLYQAQLQRRLSTAASGARVP